MPPPFGPKACPRGMPKARALGGMPLGHMPPTLNYINVKPKTAKGIRVLRIENVEVVRVTILSFVCRRPSNIDISMCIV